MEEDDLLTPYKEVSYELYEKRTLDSPSWETDNSWVDSSVEDEVDEEPSNHAAVAEEVVPEPEPKPEPEPEPEVKKPATPEVVEPPVEAPPKRKRGRPRKPKPPTPVPTQVQNVAAGTDQDNKELGRTLGSSNPSDTPVQIPFKRTRGRPRRGEQTVNSQKQLMQSLKYIIPDGMKRKTRPSRLLDDYDSFVPNKKIIVKSEEKRGRGRPRIRPPKVRQYLPDGTPRGRGRPRLKPLPTTSTVPAVKTENGTDDNSVINPGQVAPEASNPDESPAIKSESGGNASQTQGTIPALNGGVHIKRGRGRPRKYPIKIRTFPKRVARPGKKLGRPRKGEEKWRKIIPADTEGTSEKWQIKLTGLFKYVTGGKYPSLTANGIDKTQKEVKTKEHHSNDCKQTANDTKKKKEKPLKTKIEEPIAAKKPKLDASLESAPAQTESTASANVSQDEDVKSRLVADEETKPPPPQLQEPNSNAHTEKDPLHIDNNVTTPVEFSDEIFTIEDSSDEASSDSKESPEAAIVSRESIAGLPKAANSRLEMQS